MMEATEKQIKFATSLGIEKPEQYTKEELAKKIDAKVDKPKPANDFVSKDKSITAQCLVKAWGYSQVDNVDKEEVLETYKYFLENL